MTRAHLHGVTILADATMAMVTFPQGKPRRFFIRNAEEFHAAKGLCWHRIAGESVSERVVDDVSAALDDAWESHIEEAWAALEARTADPDAEDSERT